jgi:hypothetical protein
MAIISIVQGLAALYVLLVGLGTLNRMGPRTGHGMRFSYVALTTGAVAALALCFYRSDLLVCLFAVGVAAHFAFNRRKTGAWV